MVGFLVAAPVGPIAIICIHRTIAHGRLAGYVCGLGAALADTVLGAIAALGLGFLASELIANQTWLRIASGTLLVALGLRLTLSTRLTRRGVEAQEREEEYKGTTTLSPSQGLNNHIGNFASSFAVMITNPITLLSFAAIFAAINIAELGKNMHWAVFLVVGVFAGGALWWTLLITVSSLFRHRINEQGILWISRGAGFLVLIFGIVILFFPELLPQRAGSLNT